MTSILTYEILSRKSYHVKGLYLTKDYARLRMIAKLWVKVFRKCDFVHLDIIFFLRAFFRTITSVETIWHFQKFGRLLFGFVDELYVGGSAQGRLYSTLSATYWTTEFLLAISSSSSVAWYVCYTESRDGTANSFSPKILRINSLLVRSSMNIKIKLNLPYGFLHSFLLKE